MRIDIDANRDGAVEQDEPGRWDWTWSATGSGAILLPDVDVEAPGTTNAELAQMNIVVDGGGLDGIEQLVLHIDPSAASAVRVLRRRQGHELEVIAGAGAGPQGQPTVVSAPLALEGEELLVQAVSFPDISFRGLVEVFLVGVDADGRGQIFDSVIFRVAPWIMTPNTLPPVMVYAVKLGEGENEAFLSGLSAACEEADVELRVIDTDLAGGDRWIQDEIEFGYVQGPARLLDVVCDGPRNRELDGFAEAALRADGLGVVEIGSHLGDRSSLDSFGNLEVSPPVTVEGFKYPLGRIVLGNRRRRPSDPMKDRRPALRLREFLYAQEVQAPFEIYTDWLAVGHVDEIISFVPATNQNCFEVLLASPRHAKALFDDLAANGHGGVVCWEGRERRTTNGPIRADETVDEFLARTALWEFNFQCQEYLDDVRDQLLQELGIDALAIKEIPVAFKNIGTVDQPGALAYFPDMVNHLVLGEVSVVPKPYGPQIDGTDPLEDAFMAAVPDRKVRFIDDWLAYHEMSGEVHCGTNTRRRPPADVRWWDHRPSGSHDASVRPRS